MEERGQELALKRNALRKKKVTLNTLINFIHSGWSCEILNNLPAHHIDG